MTVKTITHGSQTCTTLKNQIKHKKTKQPWMVNRQRFGIDDRHTLAGVEVTEITNHPAFNRSNKLSSKDTSYVKPNASLTVVNNLQKSKKPWDSVSSA